MRQIIEWIKEGGFASGLIVAGILSAVVGVMLIVIGSVI